MDRTLDRSPSPSSSDSDAYNTESARVYFGPLKTPERKFVAATQGLFPAPQPAMLRRSPRLSSPRLRSISPMDVQVTEQDIEDIEQVALLVNESDDESGDAVDSQTGTPQMADFNLDEPSSVLADRVIHALDNPSPPPSPPSALRIFDPYHTTIRDTTMDYQSDLMSLRINDNVDSDDENPLLVPSTVTPSCPLSSSEDLESKPTSNVQQEYLISFDNLPTPTRESDGPGKVDSKIKLLPSQPTLSVDDLLSQSPNIQRPASPGPQQTIPAVIVDPPPKEMLADNFAMSVDSSDDGAKEAGVEQESSALGLNVLTVEEGCISEKLSLTPSPSNEPLLADEPVTPPLRRSTRPRRSVTPNLVSGTSTDYPVLVPPASATRIKKKAVYPNFNEEIVSDSQDEDGGAQETTAQPPTPSSTIIRVRHRSPGKVPFSFQRQLGSLSPTSTNVLSTLGFSADEPDNVSGDASKNQPESSSSARPMFSFSVFTPPVDTPAPSTPARSTGPIRFSSPSKGSASPNKYTIQLPEPGDPTNTPARRVPIAQTIQQSIPLGYNLNGTPLPSVPTPARRVPPSEGPASLATKSSNLRFGSPAKSAPGQRESSTEPSQRLAPSLKGKEKASQPPYQPGTTLSKLPFPLVPATPVPAQVSMSFVQASSQEIQSKPITSPVKSSLKQPTSRIPRIGMKPYDRKVAPNAAEKMKATTASRKLDLGKQPLSKPSVAESASTRRKNVLAVELGKSIATSTSRVKPIASTSTTVLKRKREPEKASPAKPRVIMLRQVPAVVLPAPPASHTQSTAEPAKKPATGPRQIRRVVSPEPNNTIVVKPRPRIQSPPLEPERIGNASVSQQPIAETTTSDDTALPSEQVDNLGPGSPMKQDALTIAQDHVVEPQPVIPILNIPEASEADESIISGLRRTTRSRRAASASGMRDLFTEGSSRPAPRRKPASLRYDDVFSGMSLTALKDLTTSNTVKNQRYLTAKLEMEVIRKEGLRPESPAVKVRTIVQRQQDEKDRQRAERARRRSRRSDEMIGSSDLEDDNDTGYSSQVDEVMGDSEVDEPMKHRRGAGDDDDYETPEKYSHHFKPTRLFGEASDGHEERQPKRRVKWDRGLFTTVYIDEVKLGSRQYLKENRDLKGILAPTAKALRLDTLGNLPHVDSPLGDLVQENITVKKIVYDDDVPAPAPEIVVKTRSKAKRK